MQKTEVKRKISDIFGAMTSLAAMGVAARGIKPQ